MLDNLNREGATPARVVIVGASGFIGRALVERLAAAGTPVLPLGRDRVDLTGEDAAAKLVSGLRLDDAVVFLAALTPDRGRGISPFLANLKMAAAVCTALEQTPPLHLVYVSSDAVYPFQAALINEASCAEPTDLYGAMHIARELMMKQFVKVPVAVLRPTLIYGAGDPHNSYGPNRLRRMAHKDRRITLFGEGEETRDHIYIDDVIALIELVLRHRSCGLLNLATGHSVSYAELAKLVAGLCPFPVEITGSPRQNPVTHRAFDVTALQHSFPAFTFTPLEQGLAKAQAGEASLPPA